MLWSFLYSCALRVFEFTVSSRRDEVDKDLEILVLRHQVRMLQRQVPGRVVYRPADRALLAVLGRLLPRTSWAAFLVTRRPYCAGSGSWPSASGSGGGGGPGGAAARGCRIRSSS